MAELHDAEAIMAAEATGSRMPIIKNELKYKIQKKRRESGLDELTVEYNDPEPEVVSICAQQSIPIITISNESKFGRTVALKSQIRYLFNYLDY